MTSFSVILSQKTRIELEKLSQEVQERIKKKLKQTKDNPFHYFERLKGRFDYILKAINFRIN